MGLKILFSILLIMLFSFGCMNEITTEPVTNTKLGKVPQEPIEVLGLGGGWNIVIEHPSGDIFMDFTLMTEVFWGVNFTWNNKDPWDVFTPPDVVAPQSVPALWWAYTSPPTGFNNKWFLGTGNVEQQSQYIGSFSGIFTKWYDDTYWVFEFDLDYDRRSINHFYDFTGTTEIETGEIVNFSGSQYRRDVTIDLTEVE